MCPIDKCHFDEVTFRCNGSLDEVSFDEVLRNEHHTKPNPPYPVLLYHTLPYPTPPTYLTHVPTYIEPNPSSNMLYLTRVSFSVL